VLRLVQERLESLDPVCADSVYESLVVNQIFDGLVALDPGLHIVPALAASWIISPDGREYTFHLRDHVRFQDGRPLSAHDVVYTLRRLLAPAHANARLASPYMAIVAGARDYSAGRSDELPGVEALDAGTVRIRLEHPYLAFLDALALDGLRIVPQHVIERVGEAAFARAPVGTGPFRLESWDEDGLRLAAWAEHFRGRPHLDGVHVSFPRPSEPDAGVGRFLSHELDAIEVGSDHLDAVAREPGVVVHRYQELSVHFLGLSTAIPPLDDVRVRRAIAHALDRAALAADAPLTRRAATGILPPGLPGYSPAVKTLPYDPAESRRLLREVDPDEAGLAPIELLAAGATPGSRRMVERVRADLAAVGLRLAVREADWSELGRRIDERTAQAFMLGWIADLGDPDSFLSSLFATGGAVNYFRFEDAETARLLADGARELNPVERARIYREAESRILSLAPVVPLHHSIGALAVQAGVHGLEPGPMGLCGLDLERVWIEAERPPR
jgi:ABC-type transport system substrate-binding protein